MKQRGLPRKYVLVSLALALAGSCYGLVLRRGKRGVEKEVAVEAVSIPSRESARRETPDRIAPAETRATEIGGETVDRSVSATDRVSTVVSRLEKVIRGEGGGDPGENLLRYLRLKEEGDPANRSEQDELQRRYIDELSRSPEHVLPLVGKSLTDIRDVPGSERVQADLFGLVALYPPSENAKISQAALKAVERAYASEGDASHRSEIALTAAQAYLFSTAADERTARARLAKVLADPVVSPLVEGILRMRFH